MYVYVKGIWSVDRSVWFLNSLMFCKDCFEPLHPSQQTMGHLWNDVLCATQIILILFSFTSSQQKLEKSPTKENCKPIPSLWFFYLLWIAIFFPKANQLVCRWQNTAFNWVIKSSKDFLFLHVQKVLHFLLLL